MRDHEREQPDEGEEEDRLDDAAARDRQCLRQGAHDRRALPDRRQRQHHAQEETEHGDPATTTETGRTMVNSTGPRNGILQMKSSTAMTMKTAISTRNSRIPRAISLGMHIRP
jgi:hypothetical protein